MQSQASKQQRECYIVCMRLRSKGNFVVLVFARKLSIFDEGHRVAAADNDYAAAAAAERASETCLQYNLKQMISIHSVLLRSAFPNLPPLNFYPRSLNPRL